MSSIHTVRRFRSNTRNNSLSHLLQGTSLITLLRWALLMLTSRNTNMRLRLALLLSLQIRSSNSGTIPGDYSLDDDSYTVDNVGLSIPQRYRYTTDL